MFLKSLILRGFKTFADKTVIEFNPAGGITAVVGPNGCGKSNILDSIRWVLGEQSTKTLRTDSQQEVIFAGSSERKPLSLAEVTLLMDNSDGLLKTDYDEVAVKRRVFREGESEFFINKNICRLKDVRDLFLDTGLGSGSYSIINQGQVDAVLSSKPEDRRAIFEEAAGINKYKHRKMAAERKLIASEQNLLRINDLKREISEQVAVLSEQARKAQEYLALKKRAREIDIVISRRQLQQYFEKKQTIEQKINELNQQIQEASGKSQQVEEKRQQIRAQIKEVEKNEREARYAFTDTISSQLSDAVFKAESEYSALKNKLRDMEEDERFINFEANRDAAIVSKNQARRSHAQETLNGISTQIDEAQKKLDGLLADLQAQKSGENAHNEPEALNAIMDSLRDVYNRISQAADELMNAFSGDDMQAIRVKSMQTSSYLGALKEEFKQAISKFESVLSRRQTALGDLEEKQKEEANLKLEMAKNIARHESLQKEIEELRIESEMLSVKIENRKEAVEKAAGEKGKAVEELRNIEAQLEELKAKRQEEKEISRKRLEEFIQKREALEKELEILEGESHRGGPQITQAQSELMSAEVALAKLEGENQSLEQKVKDEFGVSTQELLSPEYENINPTGATKAELERMRQSMLQMEPVNFLAMEEYDKNNSRLSFIDSQYADLVSARENLKTLIYELDVKARESFIRTVELVGENFSNIFTSLFEGGEARVVLTEAENVLDSGIEIMVRPYGRKMLNLSLLSGGERALTAIALLFALLKTHPSPFCFLDEVDAALDEANVRRFTKMLRDFSTEIQMVVITHNKNTMAVADLMYGITMQEPGISKVISMKLAQVV